MKHELEAWAIARWPAGQSMLIVNELGYKVSLEVEFETI